MRVLFYSLFFLFCLTSGITWSVTGGSGASLASRFTLAELAGVFFIFSYLYVIFMNKNKSKVYAPQEYKYFLAFFVVAWLGVIFSKYPEKGIAELVVVFFAFLISFIIYNFFLMILNENKSHEEEFSLLLRLSLLASSIIAFLGLLHFFFFPTFVNGVAGGLSGTFRNTGQAGAYFSIFLALIIPAFLSGIIKPRLIYLLCALILFLALVFTFKRSAWIGFLIGVFFLNVRMLMSKSKSDKKIASYLILFMIFMIPIFSIIFSWSINNIEGVAWRFNSKISTQSVESYSQGFFMDNLFAAYKAISLSPFLGVGLGNIGSGYITRSLEIHSSYLAIIGLTGLLGTSFYIFYMFSFVRRVKSVTKENIFGSYLYYYYPMLLGLLVSWGYTIHYRKREYWIMLAICLISAYLYRQNKIRIKL